MRVLLVGLPVRGWSGGQAAENAGGAAHVPPAIYLGTAWYPEQWPESRWEADLELMEKAHVRFVRITEFAWSAMEPSEGNYQMDWVERAIRMAERHHIAVVLGTPSAAPPAWLTSKYPETLRTKEDGQKDQHGNRQQFDWSDGKYRELAGAIATKMAERFGHDPNVIGWQIEQRVCERELWREHAGAVPAVAEGEIWNAGQPEPSMDDCVLERNVSGLVTDYDRDGAWQSGAAAGLAAVCERYVEKLPAGADGRDPGACGAAAVDYDEHDGVVRCV